MRKNWVLRTIVVIAVNYTVGFIFGDMALAIGLTVTIYESFFVKDS